MGIVSAGAGRGVGPSCGLKITPTIDIHAVGTHTPLWDQVFDNPWDFNVLPAIPAGMGIANPADGSTGALTVSVPGVWAFTFEGGGNAAADANIRGVLNESFAGNCAPFGPTYAGVQYATLTVIYSLPAGAAGLFQVSTLVAAAAGAYAVHPELIITRLA